MRTLTALVLGGWLLGTLLVGGVAAENFFRIDRLLDSPSHSSFQDDVARRLPAGEARAMLRYLASELNRVYFYVWGWVQLVLGAACFAVAALKLKQKKLLIGFSVMLAVVAVMAFYITPEIIEVGRSPGFCAPRAASARHGRLRQTARRPIRSLTLANC